MILIKFCRVPLGSFSLVGVKGGQFEVSGSVRLVIQVGGQGALGMVITTEFRAEGALDMVLTVDAGGEGSIGMLLTVEAGRVRMFDVVMPKGVG